MNYSELIIKLQDLNKTEALNLLQDLTKNGTKIEIFVSDYNDKIWNSGLTYFLQEYSKWYNVKNGFKAILS